MTGAIILGGASLVSLLAAFRYAIRNDSRKAEAVAAGWITASVLAIALSMFLASQSRPHKPSRVAFLAESASNSLAAAPVPGAPLVRVTDAPSPRVAQAFAAAAEMPLRRLEMPADAEGWVP